MYVHVHVYVYVHVYMYVYVYVYVHVYEQVHLQALLGLMTLNMLSLKACTRCFWFVCGNNELQTPNETGLDAIDAIDVLCCVY